MSDEPRRRAYIVSHTHWDREWYLPFHEFRVRLTTIVRAVLDRLEQDGSFRHFLLDGQAIILEDHLELHPDDRVRIERLVGAGKLSIGPWYILPDEFLVSGESTVRNLLVGHAIGREFGRVQQVGYMPDSFGHISQMPQILRSAGIDSFVYTRGDGDELDDSGLEHRWRAPDGSEVLAIHQWRGYCNAAGLGLEEIWHSHTPRKVDTARAVERVRELFSEMQTRSRTGVLLLNNGCDHFPPQRDFDRVFEALCREFPETEFLHASLEDYVSAIRDCPSIDGVHRGDLLSGKYHPILSGVWSARIYLKQRNDACEELLAGSVEPLAAYARFCLGQDYPGEALEYAWKLLMKNHPHDSICGCSTDEVHREMLPRFDGVVQTGEQLIRARLEAIAPTFARQAAGDSRTVICIANPLPEPRKTVVERMVVLGPPAIDVDALRLEDQNGEPVPFAIVENHLVERFWGIDYRKELSSSRQRELFQVYLDRFRDRILRDEARRDESDRYLTIQFVADLPALGHANYFLKPGKPTAAARSGVVVSDDTIENEFLRVRLHPDGRFDVCDRRSGRRWNGLNRLESTEDVGDEYDYSSAETTETITSEGANCTLRVLRDTGLEGSLEADFVLRLPVAIARDRKCRATARADCRARVRVRLLRNDPTIDVELLFDNQVGDHRLRVEFPTGLRSDRLIVDGQFHVQQRPIERHGGADWVQPTPPTWPQQEFSAVQDGLHGLAVLERGLPEIEGRRDDDGNVSLLLTLLRGVDWLSRDDFETRRFANAGPTLYTPEAQCPGEQRFRYAVVPYDGAWLEADIKGISRRWRNPPHSIQGVEDGLTPGGRSLLSKGDPRTCISAIKKHETRETLIVRLYNLSGEPVEETLTLGPTVARAFKTDLLEQRRSPLPADSHAVVVTLRPHEIVTIECEFGRADQTNS